MVYEEEVLSAAPKLAEFLGPRGVRYFQLLHQFHGGIPLAVQLNAKRKGMSFHPIHLREGMQIRNFLRDLPECSDWDENKHEMDDNYLRVLCAAIDRDYRIADIDRHKR